MPHHPQTSVVPVALEVTSERAGTGAQSVVRSALRQGSLVVAGSLLVALAAQLAVYLPGVPVPITAQTLAVLLVGAALGARAAAASMLLYWLEGLSGLPVFAAGTAGPVVALGPGGGFLLGFVPGAYLVGRAVETGWASTRLRQGAALLAGASAIFLLGTLWLSALVGARAAVQLGFLPFVAGDIGKVLIACALVPVVARCRKV